PPELDQTADGVAHGGLGLRERRLPALGGRVARGPLGIDRALLSAALRAGWGLAHRVASIGDGSAKRGLKKCDRTGRARRRRAPPGRDQPARPRARRAPAATRWRRARAPRR